MDRMLELCPETSIDLNFSLDGLQQTHDKIRGVPNNFVRTLAIMAEAAKRYRGVRRLRRNVLTVITRENYDEIVAARRVPARARRASTGNTSRWCAARRPIPP